MLAISKHSLEKGASQTCPVLGRSSHLNFTYTVPLNLMQARPPKQSFSEYHSPSAQPHITALLGFMVPSLDLSQIEIGLEATAIKQGLRDRWTAELEIQCLEPMDSLSVLCYHSYCSFPFTRTSPFTFLLHKQISMAQHF